MPDLPFLAVEGDVHSEAAEYINKKILIISWFLVLIAAILSMAGLYSQISLKILHRTKEIAVRKIFGASIPGIIKLLSYEFIVILCIGSAAGITAGYYVNTSLMNSIWSYYTNLTPMAFILPVLIIFAISMITVSAKPK